MFRLLLSLLATLVVLEPALAQVYVVPRRPGKTKVEYFHQDWQHADLLVDEEIGASPAGGVRLFFYEDEREIALRAAATIEEAYRYLADAYAYTPESRFSYILYSTYKEFLRTNLFPLQEGTLGVTSTRSLEVTLPYFGDHQQFEEVSTHELAHEFFIQKVRSVADEADAAGDPLQGFPLWFIEGSAEYYAQRGLDPETEMLVRDMVANPDVLRGFGFPGFFDDYRVNLWVYKGGQVRVAFLEETYGEGTIQEIIDGSAWMVGGGPGARGFPGLVERVTGDDRDAVARKFESWVKRRAFPQWLQGTSDPGDLRVLQEFKGIPNAVAASPDANLLVYRSIDPYTGRARLYITDPRSHPRSQKRIVSEGLPGVESLHSVLGRTFDARAGKLIYVAESRGHDVLYLLDIEHRAEELEEAPRWAEYEEGPWYDVRIKLRDDRSIRLAEHGLVAAFHPVISPDGEHVAFVGLSRQGVKDVYRFDLGAEEPSLTRLTDDTWAERHLAWGEQGLIYNSDATSHRFYNLFRIDPLDPGTPERLTTEPRDHHYPAITADGRVLFQAFDASGHSDLYEVTEQGVVRRTRTPTGLLEPSPAAGEGLWALLQEEGRKRPAKIETDDLIDGEPRQQPPAADAVPRPTVSLDDSIDYSATRIKNWRPGNIFGYLGAGGGAIYGQVFASAYDQLRDHTLVLNASVYGSFRLTDGYLSYMNQGGRVAWGGAAFHALRFRIDRTFEGDSCESLGGEGGCLFQSNERFFGGQASLRYPFDRYTYLQLDQAFGGVDYFLFDGTRFALDQEGLLDRWDNLNGKQRFQSESTLRLGYDTIQYHRMTGPNSGTSVMLEGTVAVQPFDDVQFATTRFDAEQYVALPLIEGANVGLRLSAGDSFGGRYARSYYLSSYDTLRAVRFGNPDFLIGRRYWFSRLEGQVPLNFILRSALFSSVEAIAGVDFGAVGDEYTDLWDKRVLDVAIGGNIAFGALVLRLHWARSIDIGAPLPTTHGNWHPNISLGWIQF